jgi:hypothetical protein
VIDQAFTNENPNRQVGYKSLVQSSQFRELSARKLGVAKPSNDARALRPKTNPRLFAIRQCDLLI